MDPFEVRMQFLAQLKRLTAYVFSSLTAFLRLIISQITAIDPKNGQLCAEILFSLWRGLVGLHP